MASHTMRFVLPGFFPIISNCLGVIVLISAMSLLLTAPLLISVAYCQDLGLPCFHGHIYSRGFGQRLPG